MDRKDVIRTILTLGSVVLMACTATPADGPAVRPIPLTVLDSSTHCTGPDQTARAEWIARPDETRRLPGRPTLPTSRRQYDWDPAVEGMLWISMGSRPTGGYRIELAAPTAEVHGKTATVHVRWIEPAADSFVTQAVTSPCLLLKMPQAGIRRVLIKDQDDRLRLQVRVPGG